MTPPPTTATSACGSCGRSPGIERTATAAAVDCSPCWRRRLDRAGTLRRRCRSERRARAVGRAPVPDLRRHARRAPAGVRARAARCAAASTSSSCAARTLATRSSSPRPTVARECVRGRRRAVHPQRPARPRRRGRRRRRARRPGRHAGRRGARDRRPRRARRPVHARPEQVDARPRSPTTSASARSTRRRPSPAAPPSALELVSYAARNATVPCFAIGGIDEATIDAVDGRGRQRAPRRAGDRRGRRPRGGRAAPARTRSTRARRACARAAQASEERNARASAPTLRPLAPGERPTPLVVAVVDRGPARHRQPRARRRPATAARRGAGDAARLLRADVRRGLGHVDQRYSAVLLFQILLAILVVFVFLFLLRASSVGDVRAELRRDRPARAGCSGSSCASWRGSRCRSIAPPDRR